MGFPEEGGGNFLIDGYEILRQLQENPETRRPVNDVNVEQGIKCRSSHGGTKRYLLQSTMV